jgi:dihydrodipicolinate synthase/N-acetylneuraminate lyase
MNIPLQGVIVPLITPFDDQNRIDLPAVRQVVDYVISQGVQAVMVAGTTGEGMLLSLEERKLLLEVVAAQTNRRVLLIAHTGCIDTGSTADLTRHASRNGADIISAIVPYFYTFDDEQLLGHFKRVADTVPEMPVLLYTFPGNAKNDLSPLLLERLLKAAPNIVGIKSSNPDLGQFQEYVRIGGKEFTACFGVDHLMLAGLACGSKAQISGNANSFPLPFLQLYKAFQAGDIQTAQELQKLINAIVGIHQGGKTTAFLKATLKMKGIPAGKVRPPMRELTLEEMEEVQKAVKKLGLI